MMKNWMHRAGIPGIMAALGFTLFGIMPGQATAAMVSTPAMLAPEPSGTGPGQAAAETARHDIRTWLEQQGVDPAAAQERVANLTDAEVMRIAGRLDELPAGGLFYGTSDSFFFVILLMLLVLL